MRKLFLLTTISISLLPFFVFADSYGDKTIFFVAREYDSLSRNKILATNIFVSERGYFYLEDKILGSLSDYEKDNLSKRVKEIASEFDFKIYPRLVSIFGSEIPKGINGDPKVTILIHEMNEEVGGYTREEDFYQRKLSPYSNERKIIYLNFFYFDKETFLTNLSHEFSHLISIYQKGILLSTEEERWVFEMIGEVSPTILGYKEHLKKRIEIFTKYPQDPLLEWKENAQDYGITSLFGHYLLDHFGPTLFSQILKTKSTGISAIEAITKKNFSDIFRDWMLAVYLQDCNLNPNYCYLNPELKKIKILPELNLLPVTGTSTLALYQRLKPFSPIWQKFYGGSGDLRLKFTGDKGGKFDFSILVCTKSGICQLKQILFDEQGNAAFNIQDFGRNISSALVLGFSKNQNSSQDLVSEYELKIEANSSPFNQPETPSTKNPFSCNKFERNLKYGIFGNDVRCLQEILKSEGQEIYPEGLVTGYFGPLTLRAVIRFQEKYWDEILKPWGLKTGTGFVGPTTRLKLNQLLSS